MLLNVANYSWGSVWVWALTFWWLHSILFSKFPKSIKNEIFRYFLKYFIKPKLIENIWNNPCNAPHKYVHGYGIEAKSHSIHSVLAKMLQLPHPVAFILSFFFYFLRLFSLAHSNTSCSPHARSWVPQNWRWYSTIRGWDGNVLSLGGKFHHLQHEYSPCARV